MFCPLSSANLTGMAQVNYLGDQFVVQEETYFLVGDQLTNVLERSVLNS